MEQVLLQIQLQLLLLWYVWCPILTCIAQRSCSNSNREPSNQHYTEYTLSCQCVSALSLRSDVRRFLFLILYGKTWRHGKAKIQSAFYKARDSLLMVAPFVQSCSIWITLASKGKVWNLGLPWLEKASHPNWRCVLGTKFGFKCWCQS